MSDAAAAPKVVKTPKKKTSKPKKPATHPKYSEMIAKAVGALKERGGSSRAAILKYIIKNYNVGSNTTVLNSHLKMALRAGVKSKSLKQVKGMIRDNNRCIVEKRPLKVLKRYSSGCIIIVVQALIF